MKEKPSHYVDEVTPKEFLVMCLAAYQAALPILGAIVFSVLAVFGLVMLL